MCRTFGPVFRLLDDGLPDAFLRRRLQGCLLTPIFVGSGTGQVLKRSTRADCKSAGYAFGGSNPSLPTIRETCLQRQACGSNSVGRVTAFQAVGRGFESRLPLKSTLTPIARTWNWPKGKRVSGRAVAADVAQLVEHHLGKVEVTGSIPVISSTYGCSSTGRAAVSKTAGCGFKSCRPCKMNTRTSERIRCSD